MQQALKGVAVAEIKAPAEPTPITTPEDDSITEAEKPPSL
jgi:hypothetical protein